MHSFILRANAALTFAVTVLAVICTLASLSDTFHTPAPVVDVQLVSVDAFHKHPNGNDEVRLTMNITADLESIFTWNTKQLFVFVAAEYRTPKNVLNQVSLWDIIIQSKDEAKISKITRNKYAFADQGNNLKNTDFNLTMYWNVMPLSGLMLSDKKVISGFKLPSDYYR